MNRLLPACAVIQLLLCAGCVSPVSFIPPPGTPGGTASSPLDYANGPVTQGAVTFASNFYPGNSLTISYASNGGPAQDITGLVTPPPAPNGTSTFPLPPPPNPNYYSKIGLDIFSNRETLTIASTCGFFCVYPTKTLTFVAPALAVNGLPALVSHGTLDYGIAILNGTSSGVSVPVVVTVTAAPAGVVAFATSPNGFGTPNLTVTAPDGFASFYLQSLGPAGNFTITATAPGVESNTFPGTVN